MTPPLRIQTVLRFLWVLSIGIVVAGSLLPTASSPMQALNSFNLSDSVEHFCAYAFLMFLPALHERPQLILRVALGITLLGIVLEFAQLLSDGRSLQFSDMEADAAGVCVGLLMAIPLRSVPIVRMLFSRTTR